MKRVYSKISKPSPNKLKISNSTQTHKLKIKCIPNLYFKWQLAIESNSLTIKFAHEKDSNAN
jgi:hypothetical protein